MQAHQPGLVVKHSKQETIHTVTILKSRDKRRWVVEETNFGIQEIYNQPQLQEGRSLPQFCQTFLRNSEKAL